NRVNRVVADHSANRRCFGKSPRRSGSTQVRTVTLTNEGAETTKKIHLFCARWFCSEKQPPRTPSAPRKTLFHATGGAPLMTTRRCESTAGPRSLNLPEALEILTHHGREADKHRPRHDGVPDRYLVEMRQRTEQPEIVEVEIVAGIDAEAQLMRQLG